MRPQILLLVSLFACLSLAQTTPTDCRDGHVRAALAGRDGPVDPGSAGEQHLALLNTLSDLLRLDPSLDLAERAPGGVQGDLSIRGANFGQTLVLLNGLRMNDAQSGHHNMDIPVPLDAVSRIEVLRGSGSTHVWVGRGGRRDQHHYGAAGRVGVAAADGGGQLRDQPAARVASRAAVGRLSEQLTFSRDFSSGFRPDRDYRNLELGVGDARGGRGSERAASTLAYMDHPFGADQFYGNYNSWENTKTWFAGVQQDLGDEDRRRVSGSGATATSSCCTATGRRCSPTTTRMRATRRRCGGGSTLSAGGHHALLRGGGAARIHRQQQPGRRTRAAGERPTGRWTSAR